MSLSVKQLGETEDPKELVPGEPSSVRSAGTAFTDEGEHMVRVGSTLGGVSAPAWEGGAADTFANAFPTSIKPWSEIGEFAKSAGKALDDHAGVLVSAQSKAQQAIDLYREGKQAQERALAEHNAAVDSYNASLGSTGTLGGGGGPASPPGPFVDPGIKRMQEAEEMVEQAREQVKTSAETTNDALAKLPGTLTQGSSGPQGWETETSGPDGTYSTGERHYGIDPTDPDHGTELIDTDGDGVGDTPGAGPSVSAELAGIEGTASVWGAQGSFQDQVGDVTVSGEGEVNVLSASAGASASVGSDGLQAQANAGAYAAQASGSVSAEYGVASVNASGEAMVGAEAEGEVSVGPDGVHAGGEVFAGARAEGSAGVEAGGVGVGVTGEAWAGVGASADVDFGMNDDGSFTIGGELGAGLGIGGKIGGEITIDPGEVVDTVSDVGEGIADGVEDVGEGIADGVSGIGDALGF